ncbi:hypothetical protein [Marihabitans asiaticum]|uniref:Secretion/DNA translocation related CpaE-like protein n=1 Tax=Marihabitans asiaticum TaxID=415218 RepID=A0A560WDH3_9MICO|nr:hypothetical protein [Marihabitans asiaticum]TWD15719.1 hypothetical protein FB557_1241 [Marihabitans asiaticum]
MARHQLLTVVGTSGGLGASTLAAALARHLGGSVVDGDRCGSGIDATMVLEEEDGLRWPDLAGVEGGLDPARLVSRLPGREVPTLASAGPRTPPQAAVEAALRALRSFAPVVVDLPPHALATLPEPDEVDLVVLVAGLRPRQVRDAVVHAARVDPSRSVLVTRGSRRSAPAADDVARLLEIPLLEHVEDQPSVLRDEGRGLAPRPRGAWGRVARAVEAELARLRSVEEDLRPKGVA